MWIRLLLLFSFFLVVELHANPIKLTCEYQVTPLGIDELQPRFGWQYSSDGSVQVQKSYEVIVSSSLKNARDGVGDMWHSGRTESSKVLGIRYQGKPLEPFTRYYWRVRSVDEEDVLTVWSEVAWFETAMLSMSNWQAKWISDGKQQFSRDEDFYLRDPMPVFKKVFPVSANISSARLYIAGLGYHNVFFNGKKAGTNMLEAGWTNFEKEVNYVVHDITGLLKTGNNVVSVALGNGWYNPLPLKLFGQYNLRDVQFTGRPCLRAEIHIVYNDGTRKKIITDESWRHTSGPVIRNNVYLGEWYDARLERDDFFSVEFNDKWKNATTIQGPPGLLTPRMQPPVQVTKVVKPVKIYPRKDGAYIIDMGINFAGVVRLKKVRGKSGTEIKIKYGEALHPDGSLNFLTTMAGHIKSMWNLNGGPGAPADAWQEDRYILKGKGYEDWSPSYTFHGFRFVEITGWPGALSLENVEGLVMHSNLVQQGAFECSDPMLNKLHEITLRTFLSNVFSVQSDCPGREKMGYGADIVVTANSYLYNFDMATFYRKTIRDFVNDQSDDGAVTEMAPFTGIASKGYGGRSGPLGWQLALPYLTKQLLTFYQDQWALDQFYAKLLLQMDFLNKHAQDNTFYWDLSDHEALDPKPEAFSAAVFYWQHAVLVAELAHQLNKKDDEKKFKALSERLKNDIVKRFYVQGTGRFDNATQSAQLFALYYHLSPDPQKSFEVLVQELERHQWHISTGIFGTQMLFEVLREFNRNDIAYKIVTQPDYPGWGYMINSGATTLWETWKYPDNAGSQNHPMFGSTEEWFYRTVLGINPSLNGFSTVILKPQPVPQLSWAKGHYESVHGKIEVSWSVSGRQYKLEVAIPGNTRAEVYVKSATNEPVFVNGERTSAARYENGFAIVDLSSGRYKIQSTLP